MICILLDRSQMCMLLNLSMDVVWIVEGKVRELYGLKYLSIHLLLEENLIRNLFRSALL